MERMYVSEKAPGRRTLSSEEREKLRSLGYVEFYEEKDLKESALPDPKDKIKIFAQIQEVDNLFGEGKIEEAGKILNSLLPLDPNNPGIHYLLAQLHFKNANYEEAIEELKNVMRVNMRNTTALLQLGLCYLNINKPQEAEKEFEEIFQITPEDVDSLSIISRTYLDKGNFAKSLEYIEKAVAIDNTNIDFRLQRAEILDVINEDEKALREFEYVLARDSAHPKAYLGLGIFYLNRKKYEEGIRNLEKSIHLAPSPEGYFVLGLAYKVVGRNRDAVESLRKFIEIAPSSDANRKEIARELISSLEK
jgi:tetratricopeptide (TPR) repeat protein